MKRISLVVLFFAILIGLWELAFRAKIWSPVLLPAPEQVAEYLKTTISDGTLLSATVITMRRLLIGYLIEAVTAHFWPGYGMDGGAGCGGTVAPGGTGPLPNVSRSGRVTVTSGMTPAFGPALAAYWRPDQWISGRPAGEA